jgi:hypothetical protein
MAAMASALTYASTALSAAQAVHTYQVSKVNVKAEKEMGELRAEDRRERLKKTLASQRIALTQQGSDPDFGSSIVLYEEARKAAERESAIDRFQTSTTIKNIEGKGTEALVRGVSGVGRNLLSLRTAKEQKKVA